MDDDLSTGRQLMELRRLLLAICTMGTHGSFIFRGYSPYIGGSKPSFFMVLGAHGKA